MKKLFIHWPTLWSFCCQETWALPLAGSFFSGLMFISATLNFVFSNGILALSTLSCLLLALCSVAAFIVTLYFLSKVYYVALLDEVGVVIDAHVVDKLFAGRSVKGLTIQEIETLVNNDTEASGDLYQIVYRYRFKQQQFVKTHTLIHDEIFNHLQITQHIKTIALPFHPDIDRLDEHYLLKQYRDSLMSRWIELDEDYGGLTS